MLFTTFDGKLMMVLHSPNDREARTRIFEMEDTGETLRDCQGIHRLDPLYHCIGTVRWGVGQREESPFCPSVLFSCERVFLLDIHSQTADTSNWTGNARSADSSGNGVVRFCFYGNTFQPRTFHPPR